LNISKLITSIFGGMVTTDDSALALELRRAREYAILPPSWRKEWKSRLYLPAAAMALWPPLYGVINRLERMGGLNRFVKYYDEARIDMPGDWQEGMGAVQAAVGLEQVGRYKDIIAGRREAAAFYHERLAGLPGISLPPWEEGATWSHYTIRVKHREDLLRKALCQGIQLGWLVEYCIPDMQAYRTRPGFRDCPAARALACEAVNLPLCEKGAPKVTDFLRRYCTEECI
jgi:dTDP-4-amino-4,6-dideoxygalactose transaminase